MGGRFWMQRFLFAFAIFIGLGNSPCWSQNANMNACIQILKRDDNKLQNRWLGRCGEDQLNQEIEGSNPDSKERTAFQNLFALKSPIIIEDSVTCENVPGRTPVALGPKCGKGSQTLSENLNADAVV